MGDLLEDLLQQACYSQFPQDTALIATWQAIFVPYSSFARLELFFDECNLGGVGSFCVRYEELRNDSSGRVEQNSFVFGVTRIPHEDSIEVLGAFVVSCDTYQQLLNGLGGQTGVPIQILYVLLDPSLRQRTKVVWSQLESTIRLLAECPKVI